MNIRPLGPKILVKPLPRESMSAGGIIIPDVARGREKDVARYGEVVGVGSGYRVRDDARALEQIHHVQKDQRAIPLDVKVGDQIIYGNWLGEEVDLDGVKHQLIHEEHVLAVIDA